MAEKKEKIEPIRICLLCGKEINEDCVHIQTKRKSSIDIHHKCFSATTRNNTKVNQTN